MEPRQILQKLQDSGADWLRIYWCDYTASVKCRIIPMSVIKRKLNDSQPVNIIIAQAGLCLLANNAMIPGESGVGGFSLEPDWSSLTPGPIPRHISCFGEFKEKPDGSDADLCPRTALRRSLKLASSVGLDFILGFEIEFVVMEHNTDPGSPEQYITLRSDGHAWTTARNLADWGREGSFNTVLDELAGHLEAASIAIEQVHIEAAPGQYEIVLSPLPPLQACDSFLFARQIIESTAARHGFRITLHPKPYLSAPGNAAHVHMSISSDGGNDPQVYESFYAGILTHLRAITACTYASPLSYVRMGDGCWSGGRWIGWGSENRETPLRKCDQGHWEFRLLDGMANPYLALAAILGAGTIGVSEKIRLVWKDCEVDPATLTEAQRQELGITTQLPQNLKEALDALQADDRIVELLHPTVVKRHVDIKQGEIALLDSMADEERRQWVIARF
ncbi:hypothetical protein B0I35DRAFT_493227 [Stachybotrys elegans]|uniref:GS catalytic domain-containing protein n=1 Tax=Stachybotrys elegans TaxID=80388 RepID=A0A8K0WKU7_9HYPO|nr:hypothetical protein B0I35DRAFT_493227 [Stachybotrys elegans]